MANSGHTIRNARWEAGNVRDVLAYYSAAPERLFGRQIPVAGGVDITFREPLGVVGVIVPWNFPMPIAGWGFAPALAAGNTVVLKPAELTPLTAIRLGELALRGRHARGRLQRAAGQGLGGRRALRDPPAVAQGRLHRVRPRSASGSWPGCAEQVKRGHPRARRQERQHRLRRRRPRGRGRGRARTAVFDNAGQDCCARSRILVQASAYDAFMERSSPRSRRSGSRTRPTSRARWAR